MLGVARRSRFSHFEVQSTYEPSHRTPRRRRIREDTERRPSSAQTSSTRQYPSPWTPESSSSTGYALDFIVPPPSEVQLGAPMTHAVELQVRAVQPEMQQLPSPGPDDGLYLDQYFAVASLVDAEDRVVMAQGTLAGPQLADSIHICPDAQDSSVMGRISFPYLAVQRPGKYRLRVMLMRIDDGRGKRAMTLQSVDSGQIRVYHQSY